MKVVNFVGRVILGVVAALLLATAIPNMINAINTMNSIGWFSTWNENTITQFVVFLGTIVNMVFAGAALLGCLIGRKSVLLALCAIFMMVSPVMTVVNNVRNNVPFSWDLFWNYLSGFGLPIAYFIGFLLV